MASSLLATVATLWRYPVKSMMGEELNGTHITRNGILGDRVYALVDDETGKVVSAKNPKKWPDIFSFRAAFVSPLKQGSLLPVWISLPDGTVFRSDQGDINNILSQYLGHKVTLQNLSPEDAVLEQYWPEFAGEANEISNETIAGDAPQGTFFDYSPVHLLTTGSIEAMQHYYPEGRLEVRRFRPNIMIDTAGQRGFVENDWVGKIIKLGSNVCLKITDPCPRCVMPTLAQGDLPADSAIFKNAIAKNRPLVPFANKELPSVGVYARVLKPGWVKRGDIVSVEEV